MNLFGSFRDRWALRAGNKAIEDAMIELSEEISSIKASIARINAKLAVDAKTSASTRKLTAEEREFKRLEALYGGKIIDVQDAPGEEIKSPTPS